MSVGEGRNWIKFFRDAGIPDQDAINYAISFENNRIKNEHLLELSRDILAELGITKVGDAIAIMKHSREFHNQEQRKIAMTTRSFIEDQRVSSTHPDPPLSEMERVSPKYTRQQYTESQEPQWEWSYNQLHRMAPTLVSGRTAPKPPPEPASNPQVYRDYYKPEATVPEGLYCEAPTQVPVTHIPQDVHEQQQLFHDDMNIRHQQYANISGEPLPVGVAYDNIGPVEIPTQSLYSDREDMHVLKRINSQGLKSDDPSNIQRKVFARNMTSKGKTSGPGSSAPGGKEQLSSGEVDRTVFTRLGEKKSGSKYYFDKVAATSSTRSKEESVFKRLSTTEQRTERRSLKMNNERDRSPLHTHDQERNLASNSRTASSKEDLRSHLIKGRRDPTAKVSVRPQPSSSKTSVMQRLGKRDATGENIFMRLD